MSLRSRQRSYRYGLAAEKIAAWYLRCKGYRILAHRHLGRFGEIDLIAKRADTIAIIEVKARQNITQCHFSIDGKKQHRLIQAAQEWSSMPRKVTGLNNMHDCNIRFDVIWIVPWAIPQHIKDAWRL
jgi:putative endonuclease